MTAITVKELMSQLSAISNQDAPVELVADGRVGLSVVQQVSTSDSDMVVLTDSTGYSKISEA